MIHDAVSYTRLVNSYHFWMAILALVVLSLVILMWRSFNRQLTQQRAILCLICRYQPTEKHHEKIPTFTSTPLDFLDV